MAADIANIDIFAPRTDFGSLEWKKRDDRANRARSASYTRWLNAQSIGAPVIEDRILVPQLAPWLDRVERRISASIAPQQIESEEESGRWLDVNVAEAGLDFLRAAADLLPSEPHISASREGDLVTETGGERGSLTAVISPSSIFLFATIDGRPWHMKLDSPRDREAAELRATLKKIRELIRSGWNGALDPGRGATGRP